MTRFYVTMTWEDWPECGSYGTTVEAKDHAEAEELVRREMAASMFDGSDDPGLDEAYYYDTYAQDWHVVDCFDLDQFIRDHARQPA